MYAYCRSLIVACNSATTRLLTLYILFNTARAMIDSIIALTFERRTLYYYHVELYAMSVRLKAYKAVHHVL